MGPDQRLVPSIWPLRLPVLPSLVLSLLLSCCIPSLDGFSMPAASVTICTHFHIFRADDFRTPDTAISKPAKIHQIKHVQTEFIISPSDPVLFLCSLFQWALYFLLSFALNTFIMKNFKPPNTYGPASVIRDILLVWFTTCCPFFSRVF